MNSSGTETASDDWNENLTNRIRDLDSELSSLAPVSSMLGSVYTLMSIPVYRNLLAGTYMYICVQIRVLLCYYIVTSTFI